MNCLRYMRYFFLLPLLVQEVLTNKQFKHPKFTHNVPQKPGLDFVNPVEDLASLIASHKAKSDFKNEEKDIPNNDQGFSNSKFATENIPQKATENLGKRKLSENLNPRSMSMNPTEEPKVSLSSTKTDFTNIKLLNASDERKSTSSETTQFHPKLEKQKDRPVQLFSLDPPRAYDEVEVKTDIRPHGSGTSVNQALPETGKKILHAHSRGEATMVNLDNPELEANQSKDENPALAPRRRDTEEKPSFNSRSTSSKNSASEQVLHPTSRPNNSKNFVRSAPRAEKFHTLKMEERKPHVIELDDSYFNDLSKFNRTNLMSSLTNEVIIETETEYETTEHRLFSRLFSRYNKHIRPTIYGGEVTYVIFKLSLQDIMEMNTKSRMLRINTEMIMLWEDVHLSWDPALNEGVTAIRVPYHHIWVPDIILFNTAESDYESSILNTNAIIFHDGKIEVVSHALFSSICEVNVEFYPFDEQTCSMRFSSWTYENTEIIISSAKADISHYTPNPEFYLENFYVTISEEFNECCKLPFSTMTYVVQMQRQSKFALFFFVMPGILINICALLVFSLPVETGEKVGLGVNSMLAMIVFLIAVTEDMPPTENLPLAGLYYGVCLTLITSNIAFSVYVLNLNYAGIRGFRVPHLIRRASLLVARLLRVPVPRDVLRAWRMETTGHTLGPTKSEPEKFDIEKTDLPGHVQDLFSKTQEKVHEAPLKDEYERRFCRAAEKLASLYEKQDSHRLKTEKKNGVKGEWQFVSRALDRLLVIVFTLTAFCFNVYLLAGSPYGYKFMYCPLAEGCGDMSEREVWDLIGEISHNKLTGKTDDFGGGH